MNFRDYLKTLKKSNGEIITSSTQDRYFGVIENTLEKKHNINVRNLGIIELEGFLEIVKKEKYNKGNMYSAALQHYITHIKLQEDKNFKEINDSESTFVSCVEGKPKLKYITTYERNPRLRKEAIRIHGCVCAACGFDFNETYGELGEGYIHIHHRVPVSELEEPKEVNPKTDLVPLCANCHSMIHRRKSSTLRVEDLKKILTR